MGKMGNLTPCRFETSENLKLHTTVVLLMMYRLNKDNKQSQWEKNGKFDPL